MYWRDRIGPPEAEPGSDLECNNLYSWSLSVTAVRYARTRSPTATTRHVGASQHRHQPWETSLRRAALTAVVLLAAAGCSSHDPAAETATPPAAGGAPAAQSSTAATEPRTEAAVRAAASEEFDSYAAGDYGAAWDLWSAAGKRAISRAKYMHLFELCPEVAKGIRFEIQRVTMDSDREAHVRVSRMAIAVMTYQFVYESGRWRFVPAPEAMNDYRTKTVKEITQERRATGGCAK